ncbi:MAG: glycine dehydrogenase, partial [Desulfobacteraceae bacterium]
EVATASHYDCGTALAEALLIALKKNRHGRRIALSNLIHPHHRQIVKTYLAPSGCDIVELPIAHDGTTDMAILDSMDDLAGVAVQSPNFFGCIEDLETLSTKVHAKNAFFITSFTEALSYGLLKNPGQCGADIVAGEGQSLGIPQSFGGPGLGILTGSKKFIRDLPGRYVGQTKDKNGKRGFVLTLSTREQHIRREKAGSNICSNNGLNAMTAGMFLAAAGKTGIREIAQVNHDKAVFLQQALEGAGFKRVYQRPFFNEFVVKAPVGFEKKREKLKKELKIVAGLNLDPFYPDLKQCYLFCATEVFSRQDMETLVREVK